MADVYGDMSLSSGSNDGSDWDNAYQAASVALNGTNTVSGDRLFIKGAESISTTVTLVGGAIGNPIIVLGCKSATTATPPATSDLIPGWRTGEARTAANRAHEDADRPILTVTGSGNDIILTDHFYIYAMGFVPADDLIFDGQDTNEGGSLTLEECAFNPDDEIRCSGHDPEVALLNCKYTLTSVTDGLGGSRSVWNFRGLEMAGGVAANNLFLFAGNGEFDGCDLSDADHTLVNVDLLYPRPIKFLNCKLHADTAIVTGTTVTPFEVSVIQSDSTTGKSSGTIIAVEIISDAGTIVQEATRKRDNGANDGSTDWSLAFQPAINFTRDQYRPLRGPPMAMEIVGDGTAQTVTVFIANNGGADYNDDDVWLEVSYPSELGTAQRDNQTTQMDLLGTPSPSAGGLKDDTGSTWGTGADNHQKLEASISPDYTGYIECRVMFAKHFGASPEILYVDPLPVVS